MGTMGMWRPCGDNMETTWGQHEDNVDNSIMFEDCDLLRHPHLWVDVWVVGWISGLICGSMGGSMGGTRSNH